MTKRTLSATGLRLILSISLFGVILISAFVFAYVGTYLRDFAVEVSHTVVDASGSQTELQSLQKIQKELEEKKEVVERTNSIVAESQSYQYQDQIIKDLNDYAAKSGLSITNIDFLSSQATPNAPSGQKTSPTPAISGVKSTSASITLKNPNSYENILKFIKSIEQNLTKMQLSKISLAKDAAGSGVSSEALTLEVYIR